MLTDVQKIFELSNIPIEQLKMILDHDKWKTEKTHEHEKWIAEFNSSNRVYNKSFSNQTPKSISKKDIEVNELTSYGQLDQSHIGKLSKTAIWKCSETKSLDVFYSWKENIKNLGDLPKKDTSESRIKTLLTVFLWSNSLAQRYACWPEGKDMHYIGNVKVEIKQRLQTYSNITIVRAYESFKKFWKDINDELEVKFDSTFIGEVLDNAYEQTIKKQQKEQSKDIFKSPLFVSFKEKFSDISLSDLKDVMESKRGDFISSVMAIELRRFSQQIPEEYQELFTLESWKANYFKYVKKYEDTWRKKYKSFYTAQLHASQLKWKKELT